MTVPLNTLKKALSHCRGIGPAGNPDITGITLDSRQVKPGFMYVAIPGTQTDGHDYIPKALEAGAAALVVATPQQIEVPQVVVENPRQAFALLCAAFFGQPSEQLNAAAVTGTNGKTTTAYILQKILSFAGVPTGLLGTIKYETGRRSSPSPLTTPDADTLHGCLSEMVASGMEAAVLEASSHSLVQHRLAGMHLDVAIYTNLTQDHLDYHKDFEDYAKAKAKLFELVQPNGTSVINADDPYHETMSRASRAKVITYGIKAQATLKAVLSKTDLSGTEYDLVYKNQSGTVTTPLIGTHNIYNALAAAGAALAMGVPFETIVEGLSQPLAVPGRLERVDGKGPTVLVDYAHTDDALRSVLSLLRPLVKGKLSVVFGCGGDRDKGKRPKMAKAAEAFGDAIWVTNDNPRTEDPEQIKNDIWSGFSETGAVTVELDREKAIAGAIAQSGTADCVLVAGKGHEDYQIFKDKTIDFDDRLVARACLES